MRKRYVWRNGKMVEDKRGHKLPYVHNVIEDIKPYFSVASNRIVDGRTQRREDLKATGCRAVDPEEKSEFLKTKKPEEFKFSEKELYMMDKIYRGQRID